MQESNCFLIVFDSTHQALRGEGTLKASGIPHEITSTPPAFKADCGISLRVRPGNLAPAEDALRGEEVLYSRVEPYHCKWLDD